MIASPTRYSILSAFVLSSLALLAAQGARLGLFPALLLLPLAAWPAWIALAYPATVRRIEARASLREGERPWWGPFLGGALWKQVAAIPVAFMAAWSLCAALIGDGRVTLGWAGAAAVLSYVVARVVARRTGSLKGYAQPRPVLLATPAIVAILLTASWALAADLSPPTGTLAQTIAAQSRYEGPSTLLAWALDMKGLLDGSGAWASTWVEEQGGWPLGFAWRIAGALTQFWLLGLVFAGFLLPHGVARRILRPSEAEDLPPLGPGRAAMVAFATTLLFLFAVVFLARLEAWAMQRQRPEALAQAPFLGPLESGGPPPAATPMRDVRPPGDLAGLPSPTDLRRVIEAERLGDLACPEGTIASLRRLDEELRTLLSAQRVRIEAAAQQGFAALRSHVPGYLDWYYSLPAEYARTGHLLVGDAEAYLEAAFREQLESEAALAPLTAAIGALEGNAAVIADWERERNGFLTPCGDALLPSDGGALVTTAAAPAALLVASPSIETLDLQARLGGAGAASVAGGLVGVAVGKLVAKEAFGVAVEALGKLALSKASGWLGGAAAGAGGGALVGSVVPGFGTTIGAAVGGFMGGVGAWIVTDFVLLELEESISRDSFEADILEAIDEAEAAFLASLGPTPP